MRFGCACVKEREGERESKHKMLNWTRYHFTNLPFRSVNTLTHIGNQIYLFGTQSQHQPHKEREKNFI